jgi:hypothetical protein
MQQRQHILGLAETKAKSRAIRSLGVRTAYEPAELAKGFAVLRLQFTGRSEDPEVEREVSIMIARRALGASAMLYNTPGGERAMLQPREKTPVPRVVDVEPEEENPAEEKPTTAATTEPSKTEESKDEKTATVPSACPKDDPLLICGAKDVENNWPKKLCSKFTITELKSKISACEKKRPEWDPRWAKKNEAELNAMKAWLAFREMDPNQGTLPGTTDAAAEVKY